MRKMWKKTRPTILFSIWAMEQRLCSWKFPQNVNRRLFLVVHLFPVDRPVHNPNEKPSAFQLPRAKTQIAAARFPKEVRYQLAKSRSRPLFDPSFQLVCLLHAEWSFFGHRTFKHSRINHTVIRIAGSE